MLTFPFAVNKKLLSLLSIAIPLAVLSLPTGTPIGDVTLAWDNDKPSTNQGFKLYFSANASTPMTNWTVLTNISGLRSNATVRVVPGAAFFAITATNLWGESSFSNVASTPALPSSDGNLTITGVR